MWYCIQYGISVCLSLGFKRTPEKHLEDIDRQRHALRMFRGPLQSTQTDALSMNRKNQRKVLGFITRHWSFFRHLHRLGIHIITLQCRKCEKAEKTARHELFDRPTLCFQRSRSLEVGEEGVGRQYDIVQRVLGFCKGGM